MTSLKQKSQFSQPVCWLSYSKNCEIQRKKAFNPTYGNLFAYAANNPVKYTVPDGNFLYLAVSKSQGKMSVFFSQTGNSKDVQYYGTYNVITNVCRAPNRDNTKASDMNRWQGNGTNPTQLANNVYDISDAKAPSIGDGAYGVDRQGLVIDAAQMLEVTSTAKDKNGKLLFESTFGTKVRDTGYMIHITPYGNTDGCIGIGYDPKDPKSKEKALNLMNMLVSMFDSAKKNGQKIQIRIED